jgi:hypothetical protein
VRQKSGSCLLLMMSLSCAEVRSQIIGPPIVDNNYNLDLRQGPVLGSSRKVALGGAYFGVAEGIASLSSNPAGVAFRPQRSTTKFDWDWTAGLTGLDSDDFDNNGVTPPDYKSHRIRSLGLMGQYGSWGLGVLSDSEIIALESPAADDDEYVLSVTSLTLGRQFLDRELTVGVGLRATTTKLRTTIIDATLGKLSGTGWEVGALWNPERGPWRFGMTYRSSIRSDEALDTPDDTPVTVAGLIIPKQVILPASLGLGASYASRRRNSARRTLPDTVFGSSQNSMRQMRLNGPRRSRACARIDCAVAASAAAPGRSERSVDLNASDRTTA